MSNPTLNCKKCQKGLNYLPYHSYAEPPAMKSKEGEIYCFDCFKSVSHCKICGKSVAQMDVNIHDKNTWYQPWEKIYWREAEHIKPFDKCGKYCDFLCSPECFAQDDNRHYEVRMKKNQAELAKGWKYCEECVEMFEELFTEKEKKFRERVISNCANLVPPSEKICELHRRSRERDRYIEQVIYPKAQKWWDTLTYEQKLAKVKEHDIHWIIRKGEKEGRKSTHQEVAQKKGVPPFLISQEFEHQEPCISCGKTWKTVCEINCGKNSPEGKTSYCASCPSSPESNEKNTENKAKDNSNVSATEIEDKEIQLKKLKKEKGDNSEEVRQLEQEIRDLLENSKNNPTSENPTNDKLITYTVISIITILLLALVGITILLAKPKRKNPKIK